MMSVSEGVKVYLFADPVDMRKGFDGLSTLVRERGLSLFSGDLFVFISRRGDRVKILTWERGGLVLWYKRLERGTFKRISGTGALQIDVGGLRLILEGLDPREIKRPARWSPKSLDMSSQQAQFQGYERHPYEHRVR